MHEELKVAGGSPQMAALIAGVVGQVRAQAPDLPVIAMSRHLCRAAASPALPCMHKSIGVHSPLSQLLGGNG